MAVLTCIRHLKWQQWANPPSQSAACLLLITVQVRNINSSVQECGISSDDILQIPHSCIKTSTWNRDPRYLVAVESTMYCCCGGYLASTYLQPPYFSTQDGFGQSISWYEKHNERLWCQLINMHSSQKSKNIFKYTPDSFLNFSNNEYWIFLYWQIFK